MRKDSQAATRKTSTSEPKATADLQLLRLVQLIMATKGSSKYTRLHLSYLSSHIPSYCNGHTSIDTISHGTLPSMARAPYQPVVASDSDQPTSARLQSHAERESAKQKRVLLDQRNRENWAPVFLVTFTICAICSTIVIHLSQDQPAETVRVALSIRCAISTETD